MAAVRAAASGATAPSPAALCPHMASRHHRTPHMPCHGHRIQQRHLACGVSRIRRPLPPPAVREDGAQQSSGASPGGVHSANDASPAPEWPVPWDGFKMFQVCSYAFAAQYTLGYCSLPVFGPLLFGASYDVLTPLQAAQAGLAGDASLAVAIPAIVQLSVGAQLAVSSNSGAGAIGSGGTAGGMAEAASSSSSGSSNPSGNSNSPGTHAEGPRASQLASMDAGGSRWFRYEWNAGAALAAGGTAVVAIALNAAASLALAGGQAAQNTSQVRSVIDAAASAAAQASADGADSVIGSAAAVGDSDVAAVQLLLAAGAVLLAPIYEEYFYRGFLLPSLARRTGQPAAVAISAAAFAASHLSGGDALQLWLLGAALGGAYVTVGRGNLAVPTLAHALYNGAVFAALALRHA